MNAIDGLCIGSCISNPCTPRSIVPQPTPCRPNIPCEFCHDVPERICAAFSPSLSRKCRIAVLFCHAPHRRQSGGCFSMAEVCRRQSLILLGCTVESADHVCCRYVLCLEGAIAYSKTTCLDNSGISSVALQGDPVIGIPLNVDRLRVGVQVLGDLLQYVSLLLCPVLRR